MMIDINPIIGTWGGFTLRWYGLIILVSIIVAVAVSRREAVRRGMAAEDIDELVVPVVLAGIVGARFFHVLDHWDIYAAAPARILYVQDGGLAIYGALVGGGLALVLLARLRHLAVWPLLDVVTPGLLLAQAIGRVACIINGDAYGAPTHLPWAFTYTNPNALIPPRLRGVPTHPYPLYDLLWSLAVFALVWRLRDRRLRPGTLFLVYATLYSLGRLLLTTVRQERIVVLGLQEAQVVALAVLAVVAIVVAWRATRPTTPSVTRGAKLVGR